MGKIKGIIFENIEQNENISKSKGFIISGEVDDMLPTDIVEPFFCKMNKYLICNFGVK